MLVNIVIIFSSVKEEVTAVEEIYYAIIYVP